MKGSHCDQSRRPGKRRCCGRRGMNMTGETALESCRGLIGSGNVGRLHGRLGFMDLGGDIRGQQAPRSMIIECSINNVNMTSCARGILCSCIQLHL